MKLFCIFAPKFLDWPLEIARILKERNPEVTVRALATTPYAYKYLGKVEDKPFSVLESFEAMERSWLTEPYDPAALTAFEEKLGADAVRRIVTADRNIGAGLISGAIPFDSEAARACRDDDRLRAYVAGLLRFTFRVFEEDRPDAIIMHAVAGALARSVAEVAAQFDVPVVTFQHTRIGERKIIDTSCTGMLEPVAETYRAAKKDPSVVADHIEEARRWLADFRGALDKEPGYTTYAHDRLKTENTPFNLLKKTLMTAAREAVYPYRHGPRPLRWDSAVKKTLDVFMPPLKKALLDRSPLFRPAEEIKGPYVFYALHVDPESTTMVISPPHTNQLAVIEALAKSVPLSRTLVVKEHITMLGRRPRGFYERIARLPGVMLVSPYANSRRLIAGAELTATITGTVAWEALLLRRPALVIGDSPFLSVGQGLVNWPDLSTLHEGYRAALSVPPADDESLALYVAAAMAESVEFPTGLFWGSVTPELVKENRALAEHLADELLRRIGRRDKTPARRKAS